MIKKSHHPYTILKLDGTTFLEEAIHSGSGAWPTFKLWVQERFSSVEPGLYAIVGPHAAEVDRGDVATLAVVDDQKEIVALTWSDYDYLCAAGMEE